MKDKFSTKKVSLQITWGVEVKNEKWVNNISLINEEHLHVVLEYELKEFYKYDIPCTVIVHELKEIATRGFSGHTGGKHPDYINEMIKESA